MIKIVLLVIHQIGMNIKDINHNLQLLNLMRKLIKKWLVFKIVLIAHQRN